MMRYLSVLPALCAVLVLGWLFGNRGRAQASPVNNQLRRGHMTLQWINKVKKTTAPNAYDVETITKQLNAKVVFDVSEEQLIFFDPNYMKDSSIPITQAYSFIGTTGTPYFGGPLGAHLVSWDGIGHYSRNEQEDSGNYHMALSGEGKAPVSVFSVFFMRGEFYGVTAEAVAVAVPITSTSTDGSSKGARTNTFMWNDNVDFEWTTKPGSAPPGWKVNVDHKPGSYRYVVTANFNKSGPMGDSLDYEETASFTLEFDLSGEEEIEAVIIPQKGYEQWMPEAADREDIPGNWLEVRVVLQPKGQEGKNPSKTATFRFELDDVSHEPGVCLNWPPKARAKKTPDLKIDQDSNRQLHVEDPDGQSASSKGGLLESAVRVGSYDWGAWGKLKVIATLDDAAGTQIVAHLKDKPDIEFLSIPKDDNGNHVADFWENLFGVKNAKADSDDDKYPKGNGDDGDALSLYEEYRGLMINGQHFRTDPNYKDVFVYDRDQMSLGDYAASGLDVHSVRQEETDKTKSGQNQLIINFNHGYANLGDKFVLLLKDDPSLGKRGLLGLADCGPVAHPAPGLPKTCRSIGVALDDNLQLGTNHPFAQLISTIAHELAHGSNVWHHGDKDYTAKIVYETLPGGSISVTPGSWGVSVLGGQESGVQDCIMRYNGNNFYESAGGRYFWHRGAATVYGDLYPPVEPDGTIFCDSSVGTGVNDPKGGKLPDGRKLPKAGNATKGDCTHQFSVNDLK